MENKGAKSIFLRIFIASLCARCSTFYKRYSWCDRIGLHRHSELKSRSALPNGSQRRGLEEALQDSRQVRANPEIPVLSGSNFACHQPVIQAFGRPLPEMDSITSTDHLPIGGESR